MQPTTDLGRELRKIRKVRNESLATAATAVGIDRSHLNKIELGTVKPTDKLLRSILAHFSVEGNEAMILRRLAGHIPQVVFVEGGKEEKAMTPDAKSVLPPALQISIDPARTPVLYTDSTYVSSNDYGLVLDIAQTVGGQQQQNVVARIGMSFEHAKKLIEVMHDNIEKNER